MTTTPSSVRYQGLVETIDKSLLESRKAFDTGDAVKECYGEDASIFAAGEGNPEGSNNMLATVIDGMIDRVNERVKEEMFVVFQREKVPEKLAKVDGLIETFDRAAEEESVAETNDRQSTRSALDAAKLPECVSPTDIISYQALCIMKQERDKLLAEVEGVETEIKSIEDQIAQGQTFVNNRMKKLEETGKELERTADICSMVS